LMAVQILGQVLYGYDFPGHFLVQHTLTSEAERIRSATRSRGHEPLKTRVQAVNLKPPSDGAFRREIIGRGRPKQVPM
jgi:hypothetical protein